MSEEKKAIPRAVIVEFDFAVLNGADVLFETAKKVFAAHGVELTDKLEAIHLAGGSYQGAISELYTTLGKKGDAAKLAKELDDAFKAELAVKAPAAVDAQFKAFAKALIEKGVTVIVDTRAPVEPVAAALSEFGEAITVYAEPSLTYGSLKWDAWVRACRANHVHQSLTVAVTGSGFGVRAALVAGLPAVAVQNKRTAYQDFGGADAVVDKLDVQLVPEILRALHLS